MIPQAPWHLKGFPILLTLGRQVGSGTTLVELTTGAKVQRRRTEREVAVR